VIDKRRNRRVREEDRVVIEVFRPGGRKFNFPINAFTKDISLEGARIWTDKAFSLNQKLRMVLYLSRSKQIVRICGVVIWTRNCDEGLYEIGVQFQHEIPNVLIALIKHLYGIGRGIPTSVNTVGTV
jgi:hypothetical protein